MFGKRFISFALAGAVLFSLSSCGKESSHLTYGGREVSSDVIEYLATNVENDIENEYGADYRNSDKADEAEKEFENEVFEYAESLYSIVIAAENNGIEYADEVLYEKYKAEKKLYEDSLESGVSFEDDLAAQGMTEDAYEFITMTEILNEELYEKLRTEKIPDDDTLTEICTGDALVRVKQVLIKKDGSKYDDPEKTAEEVASLATSGADFDSLIREYGEDINMFSNDDGYYIFRGIMYHEFEDVAFALDVDEISGVIETDAGYSIIKKCEKSSDYISENLSSLKEDYAESLLYTELEKVTDKYDIVKEDGYSLSDIIDSAVKEK